MSKEKFDTLKFKINLGGTLLVVNFDSDVSLLNQLMMLMYNCSLFYLIVHDCHILMDKKQICAHDSELPTLSIFLYLDRSWVMI